MTTPTNWPNPKRPGVPLFPERYGWHWISYCGTPRPLFWSAKSNTWFSSSGTRSRRENTNAHWIYKEPVLTPAQIAEMLAGEREVLARSRRENFNAGYLLACCNIANMYNEEGIASDILAQAGITEAEVKALDLSEYDANALAEIRKASSEDPILKDGAT